MRATAPQFRGGIENIRFLDGATVSSGGRAHLKENAETSAVYATFRIEKVSNSLTGHTFMQLQYAQMAALRFPVFHLLQQNPTAYVDLGWPHISVTTLRKSFR